MPEQRREVREELIELDERDGDDPVIAGLGRGAAVYHEMGDSGEVGCGKTLDNWKYSRRQKAQLEWRAPCLDCRPDVAELLEANKS